MLMSYIVLSYAMHSTCTWLNVIFKQDWLLYITQYFKIRSLKQWSDLRNLKKNMLSLLMHHKRAKFWPSVLCIVETYKEQN